MAETTTEFEQLMVWISEANEIPLETRRDFFAHIQKVGKIDEQAQQFIDQTIEFLSHKNEKKSRVLAEKIAILDAVSARQKDEKKSFAYSLANKASAWMLEKTENFKSWFNAKEAREMHAEESGAKSREISEVEALKAALI